MYVRDLMTPRVVSVRSTDTLRVARAQLHENHIHHLVVMDDDQIVGLLSFRDLIGKNDSDPVARVMSKDIITVEPWQTVRDAATMLIGRTHGCLPVVESGKVRGMITTTDLMRAVSHASTA
jgi:acetoin utilization protein AcuB